MSNEHIVGLRPVHDIIMLTRADRSKKAGALISFIQHGNVEEGWRYENICPFCGQTIGEVLDPQDELTTQLLYKALYAEMRVHIKLCTASAFKLAVQKTKNPLGTEVQKKEH